MNARTSDERTIYSNGDGTCFVELPFSERPSSGGAAKARRSAACPPLMTHTAWRKCAGDEILSNSTGDDCVCDVRGNPPPPTVPRVACPR